MADEAVAVVDLEEDSAQILLGELDSLDTLLDAEAHGNFANSNNITRLSATKKFDEVGPLEAAATEYVLKKKV